VASRLRSNREILLFAFYGRVGSTWLQDVQASYDWQITRARQLIEPAGGTIVAEYFDIGHTRALPWQRRPHASQLLAALRDPDRGFTAVVIGEPQRAFYANQFSLTYPVFEHFGVQLWVPEVGGTIDPGSEAHDLATTLFGSMSKASARASKPACAPPWAPRPPSRAASWASDPLRLPPHRSEGGLGPYLHRRPAWRTAAR
jgi:site-specific DNA recombinase